MFSHRSVLAPLILFIASSTYAEIRLDGTLGANGLVPGEPNFVIDADLGQQRGANLFHSFERFSLDAGQSVTFSGPASVNHIISRVTGTEISHIDGLLRTDVPGGADLWMINPNGITFGANASLDVQGSLHVSSANFLRIGENGRFDASAPQNTLLNSAPPSAFGFLDARPNPITISGDSNSDSVLSLNIGATLSLAGGDITITNGQLFAPGGQINLISAASPGEIGLSGATPDVTGIASFGTLSVTRTGPGIDGDINVSGNALFFGEGAPPNAGTIVIRSGQFTLDNSDLNALTTDLQGGNIDIQVQNQITLTNNAQIAALTTGAGAAGDISITAKSITLQNDGNILNGTFAQGKGGSIQIDSQDLTITGNNSAALIANITFDIFGLGNSGAAGDILINADHAVTIESTTPVGLVTNNSFSDASAGNITINAPSLRLTSGFLQATAQSLGDAGTITLNINNDLLLSSGGQLDTRTDAAGQGGSVIIQAGNIIMSGQTIGPDGAILPSGAFSSTSSSGNGGDIRITGDFIEIRDNAEISARSFLLDGADPATVLGDAGEINISAQQSVVINNSRLTSESARAGGGRIIVNARDRIELFDSDITTTVLGNVGANAGDIDIGSSAVPLNFIILDSGVVQANAVLGPGNGGNITLVSEQLLSSPDSLIQADAGPAGISGQIRISSPDTDVSSGLTELPAEFFDATAILDQGCTTRASQDVGRLVVAGRGGMPVSPDATLAASNAAYLNCN